MIRAVVFGPDQVVSIPCERCARLGERKNATHCCGPDLEFTCDAHTFEPKRRIFEASFSLEANEIVISLGPSSDVEITGKVET